MKCVAPFEPAICVADLDRMKDFYCAQFGMTVFNTLDVPPDKSAPPGLAANGYTTMRLETNTGNASSSSVPTTRRRRPRIVAMSSTSKAWPS